MALDKAETVMGDRELILVGYVVAVFVISLLITRTEWGKRHKEAPEGKKRSIFFLYLAVVVVGYLVIDRFLD